LGREWKRTATFESKDGADFLGFHRGEVVSLIHSSIEHPHCDCAED
jgi:hypothetical protein